MLCSSCSTFLNVSSSWSTQSPHLFLQFLQFVLASMQGLAGEGPVVVGCTNSLTVHHIVVHQALQHFLHRHGSLTQQRKHLLHYWFTVLHFPSLHCLPSRVDPICGLLIWFVYDWFIMETLNLFGSIKCIWCKVYYCIQLKILKRQISSMSNFYCLKLCCWNGYKMKPTHLQPIWPFYTYMREHCMRGCISAWVTSWTVSAVKCETPTCLLMPAHCENERAYLLRKWLSCAEWGWGCWTTSKIKTRNRKWKTLCMD